MRSSAPPSVTRRSRGPLLVALALAWTACEGKGTSTGPTAKTNPAPASPAEAPANTSSAPLDGEDGEAPPVRKDGTVYAETEMMGTRFSINVFVDPGRDPRDAGAAIVEALGEVDRIEGLASEWIPESELSRLNAGAGGPMVPLSEDLYAILQRSKVVAEATQGAFDPTFYAVGKLWSFTPGSRPPTAGAIEERLALVGWEGIELAGEGRRGRLRRAGMAVGLGAIAKGYAVDRASQRLKDRGFTNHIVEGGGDTYVSGTKGGKPWMVGIQRPEGPGSVGAVPMQDRALVTSGGYQRFFEFEGKRYAHILDPRTGWPLDEAESALSVSVVAVDATDADAYCTAIAVMGPERGMAYLETRPDLEGVIITRSGEVRVSSGLRERFVAP
ncbi:MAG: FAD:protein FMN transferase [Nannocystaceae bacterium]